jgi:hypothetical protein
MQIIAELPAPADRKARVYVVQVAAGEVADAEAMAELVLGQASSHLGIGLTLLAAGGPLPQDLLDRAVKGMGRLPRQFGFPDLGHQRALTRVFEVTVDLR